MDSVKFIVQRSNGTLLYHSEFPVVIYYHKSVHYSQITTDGHNMHVVLVPLSVNEDTISVAYCDRAFARFGAYQDTNTGQYYDRYVIEGNQAGTPFEVHEYLPVSRLPESSSNLFKLRRPNGEVKFDLSKRPMSTVGRLSPSFTNLQVLGKTGVILDTFGGRSAVSWSGGDPVEGSKPPQYYWYGKYDAYCWGVRINSGNVSVERVYYNRSDLVYVGSASKPADGVDFDIPFEKALLINLAGL